MHFLHCSQVLEYDEIPVYTCVWYVVCVSVCVWIDLCVCIVCVAYVRVCARMCVYKICLT
jgi:hypothetical protein